MQNRRDASKNTHRKYDHEKDAIGSGESSPAWPRRTRDCPRQARAGAMLLGLLGYPPVDVCHMRCHVRESPYLIAIYIHTSLDVMMDFEPTVIVCYGGAEPSRPLYHPTTPEKGQARYKSGSLSAQALLIEGLEGGEGLSKSPVGSPHRLSGSWVLGFSGSQTLRMALVLWFLVPWSLVLDP